MFSRSAHLYDTIYSFKDYAAEAAKLRELVQAGVPGARTLFDVACGTGKHLAELRRWYDVRGVDVDPALLGIARERLPGVRLDERDMVDLDLGETFDVVTCLFSSIGYARTRARLAAAVSSLARHVARGGLLVVERWITPDAWIPNHVHAVFVDEPDLKAARMNVSGPLADPLVTEMHYLVGTPAGVEHFTERHELGMFARDDYLRAVRDAGLDPAWDDEGLTGRGLVLGLRGA